MTTVRACAACGAPLQVDDRYCTQCGIAVDAPIRRRPDSVANPAANRRRRVTVFGLAAIAFPALLVVAGEVLDRVAPPIVAVADKNQLEKKRSAPEPSTLPAELDWRTYVNSRYGAAVDYPAAIFRMLPDAPADNAGRGFEAENGGGFFTYSSANAFEQELDQLLNEALYAVDPADLIEKDVSANGFGVAHRDDDTIIRRHLHLSADGDVIHWLEITWPEAQDDAFAPIARRMGESFRVDPDIGPNYAAPNEAPPPDAAAADRRIVPDTAGRLRIARRDHGFSVEGGTDRAFTVDIPTGFRSGDISQGQAEQVFHSGEPDPARRIVLTLAAEPKKQRSLQTIAESYVDARIDARAAQVVRWQEITVASRAAIRVAMVMDGAATALFDDHVVLARDGVIYRLGATAPKTSRTRAEETLDQAIATFAFE